MVGHRCGVSGMPVIQVLWRQIRKSVVSILIKGNSPIIECAV